MFLKNALIVTTDRCSYYLFYAQGGGLGRLFLNTVFESGWNDKHILIWAKNNHVLGRSDYQYKHEPIIYGWKQNGTHKFYGDFCTSILEFPKPTKSDLHPTMKPVELIAFLVTNSSQPKEIVLDTFLGSGTTLIACEQTKRNCYGMELEPLYLDVIVRRYIKYMNDNNLKFEIKRNGKILQNEDLDKFFD